MQLSTLRQDAYLQIRQKLLCGELTAGMQILETTLAKQLGMSRTPVREALRQMEIEGLLRYVPRFGVMVCVPDRDELAEMYSVREALESYAVAEATERIGAEALRRLTGIYAEMRQIARSFRDSGAAYLEGPLLQRFLEIDMEFHNVIIRAAGNRYMSKILEDTRLLARVFASTSWTYDRKALVEANRFHGRLLRALRARDPEAGRKCTQEAMHVSKRNALARWDRQQIGRGQTTF